MDNLSHYFHAHIPIIICVVFLQYWYTLFGFALYSVQCTVYMYVSIVLCILSRLLRVCIHVNCDLSSFVYVHVKMMYMHV